LLTPCCFETPYILRFWHVKLIFVVTLKIIYYRSAQIVRWVQDWITIRWIRF